MTTSPVLWIIAGVNGAGKTTFYNRFLSSLNIPFINADLIASKLNPENPNSVAYKAAGIESQERDVMFKDLKSFCTETVFSHPSKLEMMEQARSAGYDIRLIFIHLGNVELNKARVVARVRKGGHHVPHEKIEARNPRTWKLIQQAIHLANETWVYDNSSATDSHRLVMRFNGSHVSEIEFLPQWARQFLSEFQSSIRAKLE